MLNAADNQSTSQSKRSRNFNTEQYKLRWDISNVDMYCFETGVSLASLYVCPKYYNSVCTCINSLQWSDDPRYIIDKLYCSIVDSLKYAEHKHLRRIPVKSLKPFWTDQLNDLKCKSIFWHNMWINASRPNQGFIHQIKTSAKCKHKLAVRKLCMHTSTLTIII